MRIRQVKPEFPRRRNLRWKVAQRDHGVCALCSCDCERLDRIARMVASQSSIPAGNGTLKLDRYFAPYRDLLRSLGFNILYRVRPLWEADHIVPLCDGGADDISNLRTLCLPCHGEATRPIQQRFADRGYPRRQGSPHGP